MARWPCVLNRKVRLTCEDLLTLYEQIRPRENNCVCVLRSFLQLVFQSLDVTVTWLLYYNAILLKANILPFQCHCINIAATLRNQFTIVQYRIAIFFRFFNFFVLYGDMWSEWKNKESQNGYLRNLDKSIGIKKIHNFRTGMYFLFTN